MTQKQLGTDRVGREVIRLCHLGLDSQRLRVEVIRQLRKVMPIDAYFFATADPATLLFTGVVADDILIKATPQFLENEFLQNDVNKFVWLARDAQPVAGLFHATQERLETSPRYRDILAPLALGDELRAALISNNVCWGFLCLHRAQATPAFSAADAAFVRRLTPHLADGLRTALLLGRSEGTPGGHEPGLLLLADDLSITATTPSAERWLADILEADHHSTLALPNAVIATAARLQALERDGELQTTLMPKVRLQTASGQWLVVHASRLAGANTAGQIAVIFEVARPVEMAPLIAQAYALSKRESEIVQMLVRGQSTTEIATLLRIASTTVQEHLKAIFEKVGVHSRRELVGRLFAQQYQPRIMMGQGLGEDGWFA